MKLSIIVPVYNEINRLEVFSDRLLHAFRKENVEYIFINDGSNDGSEKWLANFFSNLPKNEYKYINLSKNKGKGFALRKGIQLVTGDYVLFLDSDLEYNPQDALEMFNMIKNDKKMHVLFGSRNLSGKIQHKEYFLNDFVVRINSIIFNFLFNQSISDIHCGTKIITKEVLTQITLSINDFGFEIDIGSKIAKKNYKIYEYGISYIARTYQEGKKITWKDGILSYYYLFKTRFIDNEPAIILSIIYSVVYMAFVGSYFGMGSGKIILVFLFIIIGLFLGLYKKIVTSSIILLFIYFGSLFSKGNGKIYTILIFFLISLYVSKKISLKVNKITNNKVIKFFV